MLSQRFDTKVTKLINQQNNHTNYLSTSLVLRLSQTQFFCVFADNFFFSTNSLTEVFEYFIFVTLIKNQKIQ